MRTRFTARFVNGIVSAFIVVFFVVHGALGSLSTVGGLSNALSWLAWLGVAAIGVHVITCVVTSHQQLTDAERPPSRRKKRHLALKWATGAALALAALLHIAHSSFPQVAFLQSPAAGAVVTVLVAAALAVHICVGAKSLLTDLGIDRRFMTTLRVGICCAAALFACAALWGALA